MTQSKLLLHPADNTNGILHHITPANVGWRYVGFELRALKRGDRSSSLNQAKPKSASY